MEKKTTIIIIPGFGESSDDLVYKNLQDELKRETDSKISFFNPTWNYKTIEDWLKEFEGFVVINKIDYSNTVLVGFSFGAYISLLFARHHNFKKLIICSLSPYFRENIASLPKEAKIFFGKKRIDAFSRYSIEDNMPYGVQFLFGRDDWKFAIDQVIQLSKKFNGSFELVENTGHELTLLYREKIISAAKAALS